MRVQISGSIKQQLEGAVHSSIDSPLMNVVQQQLWPAHTSDCPDGSISEALTDICDEPGSWSASMSADASNGVCLNGNVAHTMQVGRILRPVPAGGSQPSKVTTSTGMHQWSAHFVLTSTAIARCMLEMYHMKACVVASPAV